MNISFNDKRHQRYLRMWDLYRNEPQFKQTKGKYIPIALPMELAKLFRDLSFNKDISAIVPSEETGRAIDKLIYDNDFNAQLSEASITCAVKGGVVFKNYLEDRQSKITFLQPEYYFPEVDKFDKRKVVRETIAVPSIEGEDTFLYTETYEKRDGYYWCITKKHYFNDETLGAEVEKATEVNTYLTDSPLTYIPFSRHNGDTFGYSLYFGLEPLFEEYNWRVSQISKILDKHSNPSIVGSVSLLDENYKFVKSDDSSLFLPVDDGEQIPSYLTFNGELEANFKFLDEIIMKIIHYLSPLNANLYGLTKESANSSAMSIKLKAFRTSTVIESSLQYFERAIKKILLQAQQLEKLNGATYEPQIPKVEMTASMPEDEFTQVQAENMKVVSGITSIKSSIRRLNPHYSSQEVQEEFEEIIKEQNEINAQTFQANPSDKDFQVDLDELVDDE